MSWGGGRRKKVKSLPCQQSSKGRSTTQGSLLHTGWEVFINICTQVPSQRSLRRCIIVSFFVFMFSLHSPWFVCNKTIRVFLKIFLGFENLLYLSYLLWTGHYHRHLQFLHLHHQLHLVRSLHLHCHPAKRHKISSLVWSIIKVDRTHLVISVQTHWSLHYLNIFCRKQVLGRTLK